eukprot:scaffold1558_cov403-Prasinococcus_capsulatus_cf.AAC.19
MDAPRLKMRHRPECACGHFLPWTMPVPPGGLPTFGFDRAQRALFPLDMFLVRRRSVELMRQDHS